jgi:glycosyltransferase involved in cell wall biosynthesis
MNIGFEAKRIFANYTGLGNYARFVVSALSDHFPSDEYYLYTPKVVHHPEVEPIIRRSNIHVIEPRGGYRAFTSLWRSWGVSFNETTKNLNVFHGLSQELPVNLPLRVKKVVTVHDIIFLRYPQFYHAVDVSIYKAKVIRACKSADVVIAISEQTKEDLINILNVDPEKINVIYQGCHPNFKRKIEYTEINQVKLKYKLPDRYILNVGTIEERKNLLVLIEALGKIPKGDRLPLVVVGRQTPYYERIVSAIERLDLQSDVSFITDASFQDFPAIYHGALLFVYPSLFEGFGIPLLEAIESEVPVITSVGSCFSEAAGPASYYVDPKNPDALASAITEVVSSVDLRTRMVTESKKFVKQFEPLVISTKMNELYRQL